MFKILNTKGKSRFGVLHTAHSKVSTPFFMPIATQASVKTLSSQDILSCGAQIILANTYHLHLRPGEKIIKQLGGLHKFMSFSKPILTDSGGYQVFSLSDLRKITEEGVKFKSHLDGTSLMLTPEKSIQIQHNLGSDIIMCFDECVPYPSKKEYVNASADLTTRWANRCKKEHEKLNKKKKQKSLLFGIVQGGIYKDLRKKSAQALIDIGFDGYAIGGLAVGEPKEKLWKIVEYTCSILPKNSPRYLMGAGTPNDIKKAVTLGIDMFDCVLPTRQARHGVVYTNKGLIRISNKKFKKTPFPIDKKCKCLTCINYSRSYLRHLIMSDELAGKRLLTIHNLTFYLNLMKNIRNKLSSATNKKIKNNIIKP